MKKIVVVSQAKDAEAAVEQLRQLGVVHVEHQQEPGGKDVQALRDDISLLNEAVAVLESARAERKECVDALGAPKDWRIAARHIVDLRKRADQLRDYSYSLKAAISAWERWGDFNPADINGLAGQGIFIRLYEIPVKELTGLPHDIIVKQLVRHKGMALCAVVSREKTPVPFPEIALPHMSLGQMEARLAEDSRRMAGIRESLCGQIPRYASLLETERVVRAELEFREAISGMGKIDALVYLRGYVPVDQVPVVMQAAQREQWGTRIDAPAEYDAVPTLIHTPRWVSLIAPVFRLLEVAPGYRELDISCAFLVFFSIFFGILIGDAGYGGIYFVLTFVMSKKLAHRGIDKPVFTLLYLLSSCAIAWGVLTGTFFGQAWLAGIGVQPLMPALNDHKTMQAFCFFLGALHLSLAHAWRAALKAPAFSALAEIGWICVLWAAFFMAKALVLADPFPRQGGWLIAAGIILVVLFTNPQKNILKAVAEGLGTLAVNLMNNFTDVVSYIRLFAVGLAGVAVADAFNDMAARIGFGNIFALGLSVIIIAAGQLLGVILGPISVLVHGIRLNVFEFSGHAGVTWSGIAYKPLKNKGLSV